MRINKWIYQKPTYLKKYSEICEEIGVDHPEQKILKTNTKYITKIIQEKEVSQILNQLKIHERTGTKIYIKNPQKQNSKSSLIRHIRLYNALPPELKRLNPIQMKRKLKKHTVTFTDK